MYSKSSFTFSNQYFYIRYVAIIASLALAYIFWGPSPKRKFTKRGKYILIKKILHLD